MSGSFNQEKDLGYNQLEVWGGGGWCGLLLYHTNMEANVVLIEFTNIPNYVDTNDMPSKYQMKTL